MKVRLLSSIAGPGRGPAAQAGDEWECDTAEADRLVERGMAEHIIETAAVEPAENAMRPVPSKRQPSEGTPAGEPASR